MAKEISSITVATAAAPAVSYCSSLPMMMSGAISETIGMLPAMKMTEPYSPTARANASAKPVTSAGAMAGKMTWRNVCQRVAPRQAAASSSSFSASCSTGCTVRTTKGSPMKMSATTMPAGLNASSSPSGSSQRPTQPLPASTAASAMPATAVGSAKGKSTSASASLRPGNS